MTAACALRIAPLSRIGRKVPFQAGRVRPAEVAKPLKRGGLDVGFGEGGHGALT